MTLDYKHMEIGLHNLFWRSIVLTLQKTVILIVMLPSAVRDSLEQFE